MTAETPVGIRNDHSLYARWTPRTYAVTFDAGPYGLRTGGGEMVQVVMEAEEGPAAGAAGAGRGDPTMEAAAGAAETAAAAETAGAAETAAGGDMEAGSSFSRRQAFWNSVAMP